MDALPRRSITPDEFSSIISTSMDGFLLVDISGAILEANDSCCQLVGYTRDQLLTMHIYAVEAIDSVDDAATRSEQIIQSGSLRFETRLRHKNGSIIEVEISTNYSPSNGGSFFSFIRGISRQKQIGLEKATAEAKRFRKALDHLPAYVYMKDLQSRYVYANQPTLELFGCSENELIGSDDSNYFPQDTVKRLREVDLRVFSGENTSEQIDVRLPEGGQRSYWEIKTPIYEDDECTAIWGLCGISTDITEQKRVDEALRKSEEKYSKAFKASTEAIALTSMIDGTYVEVNDVFLEITGLQRDEVIGHTSVELNFWIDLNERQQFMEILSRNGSIKNFEVQYRIKNGEIRDFLVSSEIIEIEGKPCSLGFIADITERKRMEGVLRESEFFFKESQRVARIGSYRADFTSNHWTSSEVLDSIFGIDATYDRSIQGWLDIVHPDDREMMSQYLREEVIAKRNPFSKEYRIARRTNGEPRWVHGLGEATFDSNGNMLLLVGTIQDITERKLIENERADIERQLLQAQKLESLGVLAGGIAHDFNNLLAVIIGHCSLAKLMPKKAVDSIQPIEKAAERAAELCRQMLAYAGKCQFVEKTVNIGELVDEMVKMLTSTLSQNVVITLEPADIPPINADASQIRQIVMNLIINASEAIGEAQGEIVVSLAKTAIKADESEKDHLRKIILPGWYACLEVTDNGCGMDDETKHRLFEPFYTTKFTGRGLGMSAVLGIVKAHNGALQLDSQPGRGTTFKIYLPLLIDSSSCGDESVTQIPAEPWCGSGMILLVEDEEQVAIIATAMLKTLGFTVITAPNGREAMELYQKNVESITLVVTDLGMPVMDGYAFIRALKEHNPELPVIISSGFGDADITSRISSEGVAGFVGKPYNFDRLREVLKRVMEDVHVQRTEFHYTGR